MKKSFLLIIVTFLSFNLFSQIKATTEDGRKVVLNTNGTWTYLATANTTSSMAASNYSCENLVIETEDKMTGVKSKSGKENVIISKDGKKGLAILAMKSKKSIILSITAAGSGSCVKDDARINILFRDGTKMEIVNDGSFNCKGNATLYFGGVFGKKDKLGILGKKEIETMRVRTASGLVQEDFTKENSKKLMGIIDCLSSN